MQQGVFFLWNAHMKGEHDERRCLGSQSHKLEFRISTKISRTVNPGCYWLYSLFWLTHADISPLVLKKLKGTPFFIRRDPVFLFCLTKICPDSFDIGCLGWRKHWKKGPLTVFRVYRGWQPTQFCGDYNKPLSGSVLNNQYYTQYIYIYIYLFIDNRK